MTKWLCNLDMQIGSEDVNGCHMLILSEVGGLLVLISDQLQNLILI